TTALLNLVSLGLTGKYIASVAAQGAAERLGNLNPPGLAALVWLVVLLVPLAALFSAFSLALATFARSTKEGQYYLTPLLMVTIGITVVCVSPGIQLDPMKSILPVMGPALLVRELLASPGNSEALVYVVPVLVSSVGYSLLALWWAIEQFSREDVLFREAERFDLRLWLKHLLREKEPTPTFGEAVFCFVTILFVMFFAIQPMKIAAEGGASMLRLMVVQQLAVIAAPALIMGVMLTRNPARTFRLGMPSWKMLAAAPLLALAIHPLSVELLALLLRLGWLPPLDERFHSVMEQMAAPTVPVWQLIAVFALTPAICEELAFRGFILSGFGRSGRWGLAIVFSSLAFGIMHQIPMQVFNAALLGLVLGLLAVRAESLWPAVLFHLVYNSLQVLSQQVDPAVLERAPWNWFVMLHEGGMRYFWPTLVIAGVVAGGLLWWLARRGRSRAEGEAVVGIASGPSYST
ncbi:MAG: CPBP family intramembrane metalloprotease, partial [Planctomycetes bacterium]|nr:CPBP family intramembrane metalloprotease [Planctomycetota bacterium]